MASFSETVTVHLCDALDCNASRRAPEGGQADGYHGTIRKVVGGVVVAEAAFFADRETHIGKASRAVLSEQEDRAVEAIRDAASVSEEDSELGNGDTRAIDPIEDAVNGFEQDLERVVQA